jgi:large subunit ribosomal protein L25
MAVDKNALEGQAREKSGKGSARKLRATGLVPAVVYGRHLKDPVTVAVDPVALRKAIATPHKLNTLLTLKVAGAEHLVLLKDYQQDPLSRDVLHADFIAVRENEPVKVNVPLVLTGKAAGVAEGGILSQMRRELEVHALPGAIPERIEADVSGLNIAEVLHVNDLKLPEGVTIKGNVNYTLAVVSVPEGAAETPAAAAAAPAAAAAAPAAKGGAAPAAKGGAAPAAAAGDKKAPAKK